MVKLRLARIGNRKRPFYRVVAAEDSHRRDGRFIEILGTYDPLRQPASIEVKSEAVLKWLSNGAQPTDTVKRILAKAGIWAHWLAYRNGTGELGGLEGRLTGTVERQRTVAPSKKVVAKLAEDETKEAQESSPEASESAEDSGEDAESTDETAS